MRNALLVLTVAALSACSSTGSSTPTRLSPAAHARQTSTIQTYTARVIGDGIQVTLSANPYITPDGAVSPDPCPTGGLVLFSKPYVGTPHPGPSYQSGTAFTVGQYQSLFLTVTPCNTSPGDVLQISILSGSVTTTSLTYVSVSSDGWVTSVKNGNSPTAKLNLQVDDLTSGASSTITVTAAS